jgi:hypothetical protein
LTGRFFHSRRILLRIQGSRASHFRLSASPVSYLTPSYPVILMSSLLMRRPSPQNRQTTPSPRTAIGSGPASPQTTCMQHQQVHWSILASCQKFRTDAIRAFSRLAPAISKCWSIAFFYRCTDRPILYLIVILLLR